MKVLIVTQMFYPESFQINDLVSSLVERGHEVTVLTGLPNYPKGELYEGYSWAGPYSENFKGARVVRVPLVPRHRAKSINLIFNYISFVFFALFVGLPRIFFKNYDVVFSWGTSPITMAIPGVVYARIRNRPHYIWVQDLWPETLESLGVVKNKLLLSLVGVVVRWIYRGSKRILIQSHLFEDSVLRWGGTKEKIWYFPNWANSIFVNADKRLHVKNSNFNVKLLFAGNIGKAQGLDRVIKAVSIIPSELSVQLDIYGEGSELEALKKYCRELQMDSRVSFFARKPLEDMPALYLNYDALVVSLIADAHIERVLPGKVQTYLAIGKPILALGGGELKRVIKDSGAGFCSDPDSPEAFANTIVKFLKMSRGDRSMMGSRGKIYYENNFSQEAQIIRLEDEFKEAS